MFKKRKEKIKSEKHKNIVFSKCLLRHGVVRVFVSFYVLVFVRAFCHGALKIDILYFYNILYMNISSIYNIVYSYFIDISDAR